MAKEQKNIRKRKTTLVKKDSEEKPQEDVKINKYTRVTQGTQSGVHKILIRMVIIFSMMTVVYYYTNTEKDVQLALQREHIILRFHKKDCSLQFIDEIEDYPNCVPEKCGRFVMDTLISPKEANILLQYAKIGVGLGGSDGGASILDLHSGALSKGRVFVNAFHIPAAKKVFTKEFSDTYQAVTAKIKQAISMNFLLDENSLYLTRPTFFSRIDNKTASTIHDEYWHRHIDKEQYETFHYTTLLYLSNFGKDFQGGRFIFVDGSEKNESIVSIEPKLGRLNAFTSGHENLHYIEKVTLGTRYAITISFTCNSKHEVNPNIKMNYDKEREINVLDVN